MSEVHCDKTIDINLKGAVFTVQKERPPMTRSGSVVVVSSVINSKASPRTAPTPLPRPVCGPCLQLKC